MRDSQPAPNTPQKGCQQPSDTLVEEGVVWVSEKCVTSDMNDAGERGAERVFGWAELTRARPSTSCMQPHASNAQQPGAYI